MNVNEQDEKSASEPSSAEPRAGGPVITKGQSHRSDDAGAEETNTPPTSDPEPGTRAGGPVITKGPSQKQPESSQ